MGYELCRKLWLIEWLLWFTFVYAIHILRGKLNFKSCVVMLDHIISLISVPYLFRYQNFWRYYKSKGERAIFFIKFKHMKCYCGIEVPNELWGCSLVWSEPASQLIPLSFHCSPNQPTVFFSHNNSAGTVFSVKFQTSEQGLVSLWNQHTWLSNEQYAMTIKEAFAIIFAV